MPIYTYRCRTCDHEFDARQRFSDSPLTECPVCSGDLRRVIAPVGIVFKGSGFYVTDNRNGRSNGAVTGTTKATESEQSASEQDTGGEKVKAEKTETPARKEKSSKTTTQPGTTA